MSNFTDKELLQIIETGESDAVEIKESSSGSARERIREAICAFANDLPDHRKPGLILVGVKDDITLGTTPITDELLCQLADMKTDGNIVPPPSLIEKRTALYPIEAVQQITRNAIMHRTYEGTNAPVHVYWYNDRIEVLSPGGVFGGITAENFGKPGFVDYRNPNLAEAMRTFELVQRFGVGIRIARRLLAEAGHPEPKFEINSTHASAIIHAK